MDHMEHVLTCLDMFGAIAENLINFTFNVSLSPSVDGFNIGLINGHLFFLLDGI
jgi:hypothetical protein